MNEERFPLSDYEDDNVKAPMDQSMVRPDPTDPTDQTEPYLDRQEPINGKLVLVPKRCFS